MYVVWAVPMRKECLSVKVENTVEPKRWQRQQRGNPTLFSLKEWTKMALSSFIIVLPSQPTGPCSHFIFAPFKLGGNQDAWILWMMMTCMNE